MSIFVIDECHIQGFPIFIYFFSYLGEHVYEYIGTCTYIHNNVYIPMYTLMYKHWNTYTHTCMQVRTYAPAHFHAYTLILVHKRLDSVCMSANAHSIIISPCIIMCINCKVAAGVLREGGGWCGSGGFRMILEWVRSGLGV